MDILNNPIFSGMAGALIGALIGGLCTYIAARAQHKREYETLQHNALISVLLEICRNQPKMVLELDRVIPLWLAREYIKPEAQTKHLSDLASPLVKYTTRTFDSFYKETVSSKYGPEIDQYYRCINDLNFLAEKYNNSLPAEELRLYVGSLSHAIGRAIDLVHELHHFCHQDVKKNWGRDQDISSFLENTKRSLFLSALYRTSLDDIDKYLLGKEIPSTLTEVLLNDKPNLELFKEYAENELRRYQ